MPNFFPLLILVQDPFKLMSQTVWTNISPFWKTSLSNTLGNFNSPNEDVTSPKERS